MTGVSGIYLLPLTSYLLPLTSYLLPLTSYLLPLTSYLLPLTSYLLPLTSYLLPLTSYLLPLTAYLLPLTPYPLPLTSYLLPPTSYLLPLISYLLSLISYLLSLISYLLSLISYLLSLISYLLIYLTLIPSEIGEGDWLDLENCEDTIVHPEQGYDAVLCIGNSFAHLPDFAGDNVSLGEFQFRFQFLFCFLKFFPDNLNVLDDKNLRHNSLSVIIKNPSQSLHKLAISNFHKMLKPGGILIIDHRNYDHIIKHGALPNCSSKLYYQVNTRLLSGYYPVTTRLLSGYY